MAPRKPIKWVVFDFVVSCVFLGLPYLFLERTRLSSRIDEESGFRYATPTLVIGACTCLVVRPLFSSCYSKPTPSTTCCRKAAIVLSASVTFLSLPGLDTFSRTTGMVAILFAAFSMASTVLVIFRYKADLERPISHIGIEGMMVISVRVMVAFDPWLFKIADVFYQKKKKKKKFFCFLFDIIEANCYIISAIGAFGLFHHGDRYWDCFVLL